MVWKDAICSENFGGNQVGNQIAIFSTKMQHHCVRARIGTVKQTEKRTDRKNRWLKNLVAYFLIDILTIVCTSSCLSYSATCFRSLVLKRDLGSFATFFPAKYRYSCFDWLLLHIFARNLTLSGGKQFVKLLDRAHIGLDKCLQFLRFSAIRSLGCRFQSCMPFVILLFIYV